MREEQYDPSKKRPYLCGLVSCEICKKTICERGWRKNYVPDSEMPCEECSWVDAKDRFPLPGQLVEMKHTITSKAAWDGKQFNLVDVDAWCNPSMLEMHPNHELKWRLATDEAPDGT